MEIEFSSERIDFVKVNDDLVNEYLLMMNDKDIASKISKTIRNYTYEGEKKWISSKLENNEYVFSLIEHETGFFIGNIELMNVHENEAEIGITIKPSMQNKKYGQESIRKALDFAFDTLKLKRVILRVFKTNLNAIKCYQNCGFKINYDKSIEDEYEMFINAF